MDSTVARGSISVADQRFRFVRRRATPSSRSCSHGTARGRGRLCLPRRHLCRYSSRAHPALREHACIELNRGKTRVWNAAGQEPARISGLRGHGEEPVWTGDWSLPRDRQGFLVLGTPLGTDEYVHGILATKRTEHDRFLTRIPDLPDLQAAGLREVDLSIKVCVKQASRPELFVACWGGVAADTHHHPSFPGVGALGLALHGSERGSFSLWTCDFHADFA